MGEGLFMNSKGPFKFKHRSAGKKKGIGAGFNSISLKKVRCGKAKRARIKKDDISKPTMPYQDISHKMKIS